MGCTKIVRWLSQVMCVKKLHSSRAIILAILMFAALVVSLRQLNKIKSSSSASFSTSSSTSFVSKPLSLCAARKSVAFIKTHKCASSTIQNIFFRFVDDNRLSLVLPRSRNNYIGHPVPFHRSLVLFPDEDKDTKFDVLALHTRLDYGEIKSIVPNGTPFVTILRDPAALFESLYSYCGLEQMYGMKIEKYAQEASAALSHENFPGHFLSFDYNRRFIFGKVGRNQMCFDLGLDAAYHDNEALVNEFIKYIDKIFSLVMISERMDESLVLLKEVLCWSTEQVVVFRHNRRQMEYNVKLDNETKNNLRTVNKADHRLYLHFLDRFDQRVQKFGLERMKAEVTELRQMTDALYEKCIEEETKDPPRGLYWSSGKSLFLKQKNTSDPICTQLTLPELPYLDRLWNKSHTSFKMSF